MGPRMIGLQPSNLRPIANSRQLPGAIGIIASNRSARPAICGEVSSGCEDGCATVIGSFPLASSCGPLGGPAYTGSTARHSLGLAIPRGPNPDSKRQLCE